MTGKVEWVEPSAKTEKLKIYDADLEERRIYCNGSIWEEMGPDF